MSGITVAHTNVTRIKKDAGATSKMDLLAIEEPLEIKLTFGDLYQRKEVLLTITMRTPGSDEALATGFLLGEGIISKRSQIISIRHCASSDYPENTIRVELSPELEVDMTSIKRNFVSSASCGVCGKTVVDKTVKTTTVHNHSTSHLNAETLYAMSQKLRSNQLVFGRTGGLHAAGIFTLNGELVLISEDIGRHNAVDKVIGGALLKEIALKDKLLLLSGRVGYELMQKSISAGIPIVAAIGAPSSLAVEMAKSSETVLIGFLKENAYNVYSGSFNNESGK